MDKTTVQVSFQIKAIKFLELLLVLVVVKEGIDLF